MAAISSEPRTGLTWKPLYPAVRSAIDYWTAETEARPPILVQPMYCTAKEMHVEVVFADRAVELVLQMEDFESHQSLLSALKQQLGSA